MLHDKLFIGAFHRHIRRRSAASHLCCQGECQQQLATLRHLRFRSVQTLAFLVDIPVNWWMPCVTIAVHQCLLVCYSSHQWMVAILLARSALPTPNIPWFVSSYPLLDFFWKCFPRYKVHQSHAFQYNPSNGHEETWLGMESVRLMHLETRETFSKKKDSSASAAEVQPHCCSANAWAAITAGHAPGLTADLLLADDRTGG